GCRTGSYLSPGGTENHKLMWMTTANVLPHYFDKGLAHRSKEETLSRAKEMLREYVHGLYQAGQGEWDSSSYLVYDLNGMLNIYDFSPDPEARLLAKAALDWYAATHALKYRDGVFTAPNQRGHTRWPHAATIDQNGYVWYGSHADVTDEDTVGWRHTLHAITSSWRPNEVICRIARKKLPGLPVEQRNSKPNYWYGLGQKPTAGESHETVFISKSFTMGSMWDAYRSQLTRFQIAAATPEGAVTFTGGHPRKSDHRGKKTGAGYRDGTGRYLQSAQVGSTYLAMAMVPEDDELDYAYFILPPEAKPETVGPWMIFTAGETKVAVRPIAGKAELAELKGRKGRTLNAIKFPGRRTGLLVEVADSATQPTASGLAKTLGRTKLNASRLAEDMALTYTNVRGESIEMVFNPDPDGDEHGSRAARVTVDGKNVDLSSWPIYSGPFVRQSPGVLTVSDGAKSFTVDFTGEMPVYARTESK
ncbi:MAG: hypothetical protein ACOC93_01595, partial [Planctomycetota bacterium]